MELAAWFFFFRLACDVSEGVDGQVLVEVRPKIDHACGKKICFRLYGPQNPLYNKLYENRWSRFRDLDFNYSLKGSTVTFNNYMDRYCHVLHECSGYISNSFSIH